MCCKPCHRVCAEHAHGLGITDNGVRALGTYPTPYKLSYKKGYLKHFSGSLYRDLAGTNPAICVFR